MKNILLSSLLLLGTVTTQSNASTLKGGTDINIAISNELSEIREMVELYVAIGIKLKYKDPATRLQKDIDHFDKLIDRLKSNCKDDSIIPDILATEASWLKIKDHVKSALTAQDKDIMKKEILFIHSNLFKIKKGLLKTKKSLQPQTDNETKKAIMACTIIGSASRAFSAHYYMDMWKLKDPTISEHWKTAAKKYQASIDTLNNSKFAKDAKFKKLITKSSKHLKIFTMLWQLKSDSNYTPALISRKSKASHHNAQ